MDQLQEQTMKSNEEILTIKSNEERSSAFQRPIISKVEVNFTRMSILSYNCDLYLVNHRLSGSSRLETV